MLVPMAKVEIIGPKSEFFDVLSLLHEQGKLHIEDLSKKIKAGQVPLNQMEVHEQQEIDREQMEDLLLRVRSIVKALEHDRVVIDPARRRAEYDRMFALTASGLASEVSSVVSEVESNAAQLASTRTNFESELGLLNRYEPILQKIQPLAKQIVTTGAYESVALLVERRYKSALELLKGELDKITRKQCEIVSTDVDEDTTAAIVVFNKTFSDPVHKFLAMENVNQIRLPSAFENMPFDVAYDTLKERRAHLPAQIEKVSLELEEMSKRWLLRLTVIRDVMIDKICEIEAIPKFGRTEYAFVIDGWIPVADLGELERAIASRWGDRIIVNRTEITEEEYAETPVAVKNPKAIAPFQQLIKVRGVPRYGTVDPTWMLFIFFPVFYGMIVGDFGYGLIMLGVILWLRRKFRGNELVQVATSILGPAATMVVAFGLAYGEGFGDVPYRLGWIQVDYATHSSTWFGVIPTFHRVDLIMPFMIIALVVGVLHVVFGLVIGVVNAIRTRHKKHLYERAGVLTVLISVLVLIGLAQQGAQITLGETGQLMAQTAVALLAAAGFIYAIRGGGIMGAIETIESFVHVASYIRIMAVGLAGAIFADAINQIVSIIGNPLLGAFVGIVLHALHIVIASFSPMIHALRLNLLEFFGKFYETGKQPYSPFTKTGGEEIA
ncbi:MAG: hypothetical protein KGZ40_00085 [Clostridiales bacterium]|nr:hypothetical protein [Clostridiales bacterium]